MSVDPYTDVAQWLDLDPRTEAIMRHPAGKALMSDDESQARQDAEACTVGSVNWRPAPAVPRRRWAEVGWPALTVVAVVALPFIDVFAINAPAIA